MVSIAVGDPSKPAPAHLMNGNQLRLAGTVVEKNSRNGSMTIPMNLVG